MLAILANVYTWDEIYHIVIIESSFHIYAVRKHWGVENNLHALLDVVFREDKNTTLEKNIK